MQPRRHAPKRHGEDDAAPDWRLPVVEQGQLAGIVSIGDAVKSSAGGGRVGGERPSQLLSCDPLSGLISSFSGQPVGDCVAAMAHPVLLISNPDVVQPLRHGDQPQGDGLTVPRLPPSAGSPYWLWFGTSTHVAGAIMKRVLIWLLCALVIQGCADSTGSSANTAPAH